ncbi:nitrite transporter [Pseudescherichia sp.]|uniref:nitrite transporter n=1 Tax=Pseudescherichia sp. TaxID=2055881 RepID=UPI0028975CDC|nr:nitrite transporter [Pseudescherichia sp.]
MLNVDKYRSVVWQMGGRVWPMLDCYGVVHEVRRDLGLSEWPTFDGVIREGDMMARQFTAFEGNVRRTAAKEGAVAACYSGGVVDHLGIVISIDGALQVLEANPRRNVTILPLARFERLYTTVEYYE